MWTPSKMALLAALFLGLVAPPLLAATSARELRDDVGRLMNGDHRPTTDDFVRASMLATAAVKTAPDEPWGYAARCDVARRWGDDGLIASCIHDLQAVAPHHQELQRVLSARKSGGALVVGWCATALLILATLAHALGSALSRARRRGGASAAVTSMIVVTLAMSGVAFGNPPGPLPVAPSAGYFKIDDANPEANVPGPKEQMARPMDFAYYLQILIERAAEATKRGDHAVAIRYYRALVKGAPERAIAWSKLCESYEADRQPEKALIACKQAVSREGTTISDYVRIVRLDLATSPAGEKLPANTMEDINAVIDHLAKQPEAGLIPHHLRCEVSVRTRDVPGLQACTTALAAVAPDDPKTISFQWTLALENGRKQDAERLIERARRAGMPASGVARMEAAMTTFESGPTGRLPARRGIAIGIFVLCVAAALVAFLRRSRRATAPGA